MLMLNILQSAKATEQKISFHISKSVMIITNLGIPFAIFIDKQ
jgi:hypothetical protein